MIPFTYRLRGCVRLTESAGVWWAVCDLPLTVLRLDGHAAQLLRMTADSVGVGELSTALHLDEEQVLRLCEYFRGRGLLDVELDPSVRHTPSVTVVVPVKDRAADLADCLAALDDLDYPRDLLEVVVVVDGSSDATMAVATRHSCTVLANASTRGQSYCRNLAVARSSADIIAFTDSDCVVDRGWLRELVPYFSWRRVSAVGGRVESFFATSLLDRYEQTASPLDMGRRFLLSLDSADTFYVPTCNVLVRRDLYLDVGGLRDDMRVGEDVDLCWRLRARGGVMLYAPQGRVRHKHRNRWPAMLRRRAEYGMSEAILYALHEDKRKSLRLPVLPALSFAVLLVVLLLRDVRFVPAVFLPFVVDTARRMIHLSVEQVNVPVWVAGFSVLRGHLSLVHSLFFVTVRYYLLGLAVLAAFVPPLRLVTGFAVLYSSAVEYSVRRPRLTYASFLACYVLEHAAYQLGVASGCLQHRTLRPYRMSLRTRAGQLVRLTGTGARTSSSSASPAR
jgi:mycofactocin system glycosyltransferase